jgi:hypothetical protein
MNSFSKLIASALAMLLFTGCVQMGTKQDAFPSMYSDKKPVTIVVVPAINESTAADAGDLLNVTVAQPFTNHGYYVLPMPIIADIFRKEGIIEGDQVKGMPTEIFKENFGADAVLFMTIESWDKNYAVLAANVSVGIEYVLLSTTSNEVLWSYEQLVVVDTSGGSGNLLADVISTALATGLTDYAVVARQVHAEAVKALPFGQYHPRSGMDGAEKTVVLEKKEAALAEGD